jgi:hypothetical protein
MIESWAVSEHMHGAIGTKLYEYRESNRSFALWVNQEGFDAQS